MSECAERSRRCARTRSLMSVASRGGTGSAIADEDIADPVADRTASTRAPAPVHPPPPPPPPPPRPSPPPTCRGRAPRALARQRPPGGLRPVGGGEHRAAHLP